MTPPTTRALARRVAVELLERVTLGADEMAERLRPALPPSVVSSAIHVQPIAPPVPAAAPPVIPPAELGWLLARHVCTAFDTQAAALFGDGPTPKTHDPETIRRMRVGARRLRSLILLFGPTLDKKPRRRLGRALKGITSALGPLRDADVVTAQFAGVSAADDPLRRAAAEFIALQLSTRLETTRTQAATAIAAVDREALRQDLREARRLIVEQLTLEGDVRRSLAARLETVSTAAFSKTPIPTTLEDRDAIHDVRILAKRLRYTYAWIGPAFQHGPGPQRLLKRAQRAVGASRDLDLFLVRLSDHAAALDEQGQHVLADTVVRWRDEVAHRREKVDGRILPALADLSVRTVVRLTRDGLAHT